MKTSTLLNISMAGKVIFMLAIFAIVTACIYLTMTLNEVKPVVDVESDVRAKWALACMKEVYAAEKHFGTTKVDPTIIPNCTESSFILYPLPTSED